MTTTNIETKEEPNQIHTIQWSHPFIKHASTSFKWRAYMQCMACVLGCCWLPLPVYECRRFSVIVIVENGKLNGRKNVEIPWNARMSLKIDLKCLQMRTPTRSLTHSLGRSFQKLRTTATGWNKQFFPHHIACNPNTLTNFRHDLLAEHIFPNIPKSRNFSGFLTPHCTYYETKSHFPLSVRLPNMLLINIRIVE